VDNKLDKHKKLDNNEKSQREGIIALLRRIFPSQKNEAKSCPLLLFWPPSGAWRGSLGFFAIYGVDL